MFFVSKKKECGCDLLKNETKIDRIFVEDLSFWNQKYCSEKKEKISVNCHHD